MNNSLRTALVVASAAALLATGASQGLVAAGYAAQSRPVTPGETGSPVQVDSRRMPPDYTWVLPALGESVYEDLQRAQQAALDRESNGLRVAIQHARETLQRLRPSAQARQLETQLQIFHDDIRHNGKEPDDELWVPVGAGTDAARGYMPEAVKAAAHEAARQAGTAAEGERVRATEQQDVVAFSRRSSLGVFPLSRVMADLDAAQASANLSAPDWAGALEAVHSALATFHWFGRVPARGLLSGSDAVVSAYVLATGPVIRDDQRWQIFEYLDRAERALRTAPDGRMLAGKVRALIDKGEPQGSEIGSLLAEVQSRIRYQQHAEARYRKTTGPDSSE